MSLSIKYAHIVLISPLYENHENLTDHRSPKKVKPGLQQAQQQKKTLSMALALALSSPL